MFRIAQILFIFVGVALAHATEFIPSALPSQVSQVPIIVRGTIGMSYADWGTHDGGGRGLFTFYQLQVSEVLKGQIQASATVLFREIGGEKDGVGEGVPGAAQFSRGEDVVVMLGSQNSDGSYDLKGLSAGKMNVVQQEDGSEGLTSIALSPPPHDGKWTIADLKNAVREQKTVSAVSSPAPTGSPSQLPSVVPSKRVVPPAPQVQTTSTQSSANEHDAVLVKSSLALGILLSGFFLLNIRRGGGPKK